jgi:flagellar biosynthesis protein FliQ
MLHIIVALAYWIFIIICQFIIQANNYTLSFICPSIEKYLINIRYCIFLTLLNNLDVIQKTEKKILDKPNASIKNEHLSLSS